MPIDGARRRELHGEFALSPMLEAVLLLFGLLRANLGLFVAVFLPSTVLELGRLICWNRSAAGKRRHVVTANRDKLAIHARILALHFAGGIAGALSFKRVGFCATVPIAALLMAMAAPPLLLDLKARRHGAPRDA